MVSLILLIVALVVFASAAFNVAAPRVNLIGLGLALWMLTLVLTRAGV